MSKTLAGLLAVAAIGCGGGTTEGTQTTGGGGGGGGAKSTGAGDASFEVTPISINGLVFHPGALGSPGMPMLDSKRPTTIDKQRKAVEAAKDPVLKQAQAGVLATMLYRDSKNKTGDALHAELLEARQALLDAAATVKPTDKADELTLRLLGTYDLLLEDFVGAEKAWGELVVDAPKDKEALTFRVWWAYSLLQLDRNADALAAVKDQPLDPKQPELDYVIAWAKWRTGDNKGAWDAIVAAAQGWGTSNKDALDRDVLLFAGRTGASLADAISQLGPIYGKTKDTMYDLLAKLGLESYQYAGRWADGIAAIEKAIETEGSAVPSNDLPALRYTEADYTVRLDDPVRAAAFAKQAIEALPKCGAKCTPKDMENVVESVYVMGRLFHILYATAHDDRYYQPAHDLYMQTIPLITMNATTQAQATKDADFLERSFKAMKAADGKHDKDAIGALLGRHNQEVQACYEAALEANPKLTGTLIVNLEADQNGAIKGVSTEPKAGLQDLAKVAACTADRARAWKLPARANGKGAPGSTRIKLTYNLAVQKPAVPK